MPQPYRIVAVEPGPSNAIRAHEYPVLEQGNLSFPNGRYELELLPSEDRSSFLLTHRIDGAPLIDRLLESGQAQYGCIVSSPISSYRRTHVSDAAHQEVRWEIDELGEPPLFTPVVMCTATVKLILRASLDGVHDVWDGQEIVLRKGSRLALGEVIHFESLILHLLSLRADASLKDGQFFVDVESEPFRFRVNVSTKLHEYLRYHPGENRDNIMTHIVTACLARLQKDHNKDDGDAGWQSHRNLKALADHLAEQGLGDWTDPEFQPEKVATALYPHVMPGGSGDAEENGDE